MLVMRVIVYPVCLYFPLKKYMYIFSAQRMPAPWISIVSVLFYPWRFGQWPLGPLVRQQGVGGCLCAGFGFLFGSVLCVVVLSWARGTVFPDNAPLAWALSLAQKAH